MSYFKKFNKILYDPLKTNSYQECVNIFNSILVQYKPANDITLYYYELIPDHYKPEHMAHKFYGSVDYVWVIIIMNNIVNPYFDWPLSTNELERFLDDKYGSNKDGIHHFINLNTREEVDQYDDTIFRNMIKNSEPLPHLISPVSNYDYEFEINENKRSIKIMNRKHLRGVTEQFERLMKNK